MKDSPFARCLLQVNSLAKRMVMTDELQRSFSVSISVAVKTFYEIRPNYEVISTQYYVCILALVIRKENHVHYARYCIVIRVACPAVPYFSTLSHKRNDFRKNVTQHSTCILVFSTKFVRNICSFKKRFSKISHIYVRLRVKCELFYCQILNQARIFQTDFPKILKHEIL